MDSTLGFNIHAVCAALMSYMHTSPHCVGERMLQPMSGVRVCLIAMVSLLKCAGRKWQSYRCRYVGRCHSSPVTTPHGTKSGDKPQSRCSSLHPNASSSLWQAHALDNPRNLLCVRMNDDCSRLANCATETKS